MPPGVALAEVVEFALPGPAETFPEPDELTEPPALPEPTGPPLDKGEFPPTTVALPGAPVAPLGSTTVTADPVLEPPALSELPGAEEEAPGAEPEPGAEVPVVTLTPEPAMETEPPLLEGELIILPAEPPSTAEDSF